LDSTSIKIYNSYRLERFLNEIRLEDIVKVTLCGINETTTTTTEPSTSYHYRSKNSSKDTKDKKGYRCLFILQTEDISYYCGIGGADHNNTMNVLARNFYNIFKMVYLPYANKYNGSQISIKRMNAPKYEEKVNSILKLFIYNSV
jgi:hypothetical protein